MCADSERFQADQEVFRLKYGSYKYLTILTTGALIHVRVECEYSAYTDCLYCRPTPKSDIERRNRVSYDGNVGGKKESYTDEQSNTIFGIGSYENKLIIGFITGEMHFVSKIKFSEEDGDTIFSFPEIKGFSLDFESNVRHLSVYQARDLNVTSDGAILLLAGSAIYVYNWEKNVVMRQIDDLFAPEKVFFNEDLNFWVTVDGRKHVAQVYNEKGETVYNIKPKPGFVIKGFANVTEKQSFIVESHVNKSDHSLSSGAVYWHRLLDSNREGDRRILTLDFPPDGAIYAAKSRLLVVYGEKMLLGYKLGI